MKISISDLGAVKYQFAKDGTVENAPWMLVGSYTSVSTVLGGIKRKTALEENLMLQELNHLWWRQPKWTRGFIWSQNEHLRTPSVTATETAPPFASIPKSELQNPIAIETIST